ncbi:MAG: transposase [Spirulina sp.]
MARTPSSNYKKQQNKIARIHQKIQRQRKDFQYKIANWLTRLYDLIAVENLNIKGLARTILPLVPPSWEAGGSGG